MSSVLYDAPGPRARRLNLIGSILGGVVVVGLIAAAIVRLNEQGQFAAELWDPLVRPSNEYFPQVWALLRAGFRQTLTAAALAIGLSLVIGVAVGILRLSVARWLRVPIVTVIELVRATPVVLAIFFTAQVFPQFGYPLPNLWYLVIALTTYNSVIIAEILRAGVAALPRGQREAGLAIGLTPLQTLWLIQLPQAFRMMLPALISQLVVCLKDTTLAAVALNGFIEALNQGKVIYQAPELEYNPIQVYVVIGIIFIVINYLLGRLATWVERRLSQRTAGGHVDVTQAATVGGTGASTTP